MERFFPKEKIILTGNPVRQGLLENAKSREEALADFGLLPGLKTVLLIGGSLGARTLNESVLANLTAISLPVCSLSGRREVIILPIYRNS